MEEFYYFGKDYPKMKYCTHCGKQIDDSCQYCNYCGTPCQGSTHNNGFMGKITEKINNMAGDTGAVKLKIGDIFSSIFKKHTRDEAESIFIRGTSTTTPDICDIDVTWPKPWLYSRVFFILFLSFLFTYLGFTWFGNPLLIPIVVFMGGFLLPVAIVVFFFEVNAPCNISFYSVMIYLTLGGCASLLLGCILYKLFPPRYLSGAFHAIMISIIEEADKAIIVLVILMKNKNAKYRLNGLLVGATVGAGFDAMESIGYDFEEIGNGFSALITSVVGRGLTSFGGHIVWAAITGYAIMYAANGKKVSFSVFKEVNFWKLYWIPMLLHALWDMDIYIPILMYTNIKLYILTIVPWCIIFVLISAGLSEVSDIITQKHSEKISENQDIRSE